MSDLIRFLAIVIAFFAIAGLLIVFGVFDRCSRSASESAIAEEIKDIPPAFEMTAYQLVNAYQSDEEVASAAYDGSVGIVEGPTSIFEEGKYLELYASTVWNVRCFASDEEIDKVNVLRRSGYGREGVVIRSDRSGGSVGTRRIFAFKGKVEGVNDRHLTIDLRGCTVHDPP